MGGGCCGGAKARAESVAAPYQVTLVDGTTVTVENKAQERVERDKAVVRLNAKAARDGYRLRR